MNLAINRGRPPARDVGDGRGGDAEKEEEEGDGVRHGDGAAGADEGEAARAAPGSARFAREAIQHGREIYIIKCNGQLTELAAIPLHQGFQ